MSNLKKILIILLLTIPIFITTGYSAWIIINMQENDTPPDYNYEEIVKGAYDGQDKDYTGNGLGPDSKLDKELIDSDTYTFEYYDESTSQWIKGWPVDSGIYKVRVINKYDPESNGVEITFTINKADQLVSVTQVEVIYDGESHQIDESTITVNTGNKSDGSIIISGNIPRINVGETIVTIKVLANDNYEEYNSTVSIIVKSKNLADADVTANVITSYIYDGNSKRPSYNDLEITYNGMKLTLSDYKVSDNGYSNNINATSDTLKASVTIEAIEDGNYTGTKTIYFDIEKADQTPTFNTSKTYDGLEAVIDVTINEPVTSTPNIKFYNKNYEEISSPINVALNDSKYYVRVTITGNNNYNDYDSGYLEYFIRPFSLSNLSDSDIKLNGDLTYKGTQITPTVAISINDIVIDSSNFSLTYGENINVLSGGEITISANSANFISTKTINFTILARDFSDGIPLFDSNISLVYSGMEIRPISDVLFENFDNITYDISYVNNINAGIASYNIVGTNNFKGTISGTFNIDKANALYDGIPITVNATFGQHLYDIENLLPLHFKWENNDLLVGNCTDSGRSFNALYNPNEANYISQIVEVSVIVMKISPIISEFEDIIVNYNTSYAISPIVKGIDGEKVEFELIYFDDIGNELIMPPTNLGVYTVKLIVNTQNYACTKSITLTIKTILQVFLTGIECDYDKEQHYATLKILDYEGQDITSDINSDLYHISYTYNNETVNDVINAGNYNAKFEWLASEQYALSSNSNLECDIIINKLNVEIDFDTDEVYNQSKEIRFKEVEYNGNVQSISYYITGISDELINEDFSLTIEDVNNQTIISSDLVKDVGKYYYIINYDSNNYSVKGYSKALFSISKIKLLINQKLFEYSYTDNISSYSALDTKLLNDINFYTYSTKDTTKTIVDISESITNLNDGEKSYSTKSSALVGNTYESYVTIPSTSDYTLVDESGSQINSIRIIIKYKTAIGADGNYYTIEDAIKNESGSIGNIRLQGNTTAYVITSFTKLSYYSSDCYTLKGGRRLLVSADDSTTELLTSGSDIVYSVLNIPEGILLTVKESSVITVCGYVGNYSKTTRRGVLMNDGHILVESGTIYSYGYIKSSSANSNGLITLESGSTAVDCMRVYDWPGGNTATNISSKVLPTNAWTIHNISCALKIKGNACLKIHAYLEVSLITISEEYPIINGADSGSPLFISSSNDSYIIKKGSNSDSSPNNTDLYSITGNNQQAGQKDIIDIYGNYNDNTFKITKSLYTMSTSTSVACPIGFMHVTLKQGTLNLTKSDYVFMPGTSLIVEQGATLKLGSGVDLTFETISNVTKASNYSDNGVNFNKYCVDKEDAIFILSGNLIIDGGAIGGLIVPGREGVTLDFSNKTITTSYTVLKHAIGSGSSGYPTYSISKLYASGYITTTDNAVNDIKCCFAQSSYTSVKIGDKYYWIGTRGSESDSSINGSMSETNKIGSSCIIEGTLITMADGTQKPVEEVVAGDKVLVFNHETGEFEVSVVMYNIHTDDQASNYEVVRLYFSDGTSIGIHAEHYFYDIDLNKYVLINHFNVSEFIGHRFYAITYDAASDSYIDNIITLDSYSISYEYTRVFGPMTANHLNLFAEGLLNIAGDNDPFINIFEYDENMKYDEELKQADIEKYGLFTYDDFKNYISEDIYYAYNGQYLKVAIGKGITTFDRVLELIEKYLNDMGYGDDYKENSKNE